MKKTRKIVFSVIVLFIIASMVIGYCITASEMRKSFGRGEYPEQRFSANYFYDHYEAEYPREEVSFRSGENTLKGFIYGMDNDDGLIVFAHGIGSGHELYLSMITRLVDCGWRIFAYDATGSGYSEGDGSKGLAQSVIDLDNALSFAESYPRLNELDVYVLGHSWGGYASAASLNFDHDIKGCISMSGYYLPFAELAETCDGMYGKASKLLYPFIWLFNKTTFGKDSSWSAVEGINKRDIPVLVIHGTDDDVIHFDGASIIAQKDHITNPNVKYKVFDEDGRNGHNTYFYTPEYKEYKASYVTPVQNELREKYGKNIPDEEREKLYDMIDKELYNGFNPELISLIDGFFRDNTAK